jgi:hypothetical protein
MKIAFTLCSNNYLAQAKTLGDSLKQWNPEYLFYIGLLDIKRTEIDYEAEIGYPIILCNEIGIPDFDDLWKKYNIIEFNTCVKPFYFQYFIKEFFPIDFLYYIDPDILILNDLTTIEKEFNETSKILLTPHILSPIPLDGKTPGENLFLNYGIFNLGFLGLKNPELSDPFLKWWEERTYHLGFDNTSKGLFVDQLWFNLVPVFFDNVKISGHPGLNMAPWNLHERKLNEDKIVSFLNQTFPLIFYHFSKYSISSPGVLSSNYDRYDFETNNDLRDIYKEYSDLLIKNGIHKLSTFRCRYMELQKCYFEDKTNGNHTDVKIPMLKSTLKKVLPKSVIRIIKRLKQFFSPQV